MKALLVDGLNLVRRIYAGIPEQDDVNSNHNRIDDVVRSSRGSLNRALRYHSPTHCIIVFETHGHTWRHALFPDYKKNRSPMPEDLKVGMSEITRSFLEMGVKSFSKDGFEADDVVATISTKIAHSGGHSIILSTDRIHCQLLSDHIQVFDHFTERYLDHEVIEKKYQVPQRLIPDALALAGDSSLSIPGIESVGIKTAAKLINQFGNLNGVFAARDQIPGKLGEKIRSGEESARLGLQLFTLKKDIPLGINLSEFRHNATDKK